MIAIRQAASDVEFTRAVVSEQPPSVGGEQWRCLQNRCIFERVGETVKGPSAVAESS